MEYTYNASALGAGGVIERATEFGRKRTLIPSLASVALSPGGGEGSSVQTNFHSEELAFLRAETRVAGYPIGRNVFTTYTDVYVTGLRVFDKLNIALLHATVTSTRDFTDPDDDHSEFTMHASFRGIEVDGVEVAPVVDVDLVECRRYEDFEKLLQTRTAAAAVKGGPITTLDARFGADSAEKRRQLLALVAERKPVQGSLVERVDHKGTLSRTAHKVFVPGVGTLRLGELMLKPGRRRLNLLHIAVGKDETMLMQDESPKKRRAARSAMKMMEEDPNDPLNGTIVIASVEGNGTPVMP